MLPITATSAPAPTEAPLAERASAIAARLAAASVARNRPESRFAVVPSCAPMWRRSNCAVPQRATVSISSGHSRLRASVVAEYSFGSFSGMMGGGSSCDASRSSAPCASPSRAARYARTKRLSCRAIMHESSESSPRSPAQPRHWWSRLNILAPTRSRPCASHHAPMSSTYVARLVAVT